METIESTPQLEGFVSDKERLEFLSNNIVKRVREIEENVREEFNEDLAVRMKDLGIDPMSQPQAQKKEARRLRKEINFSKTVNLAILDGLGDLRRELESNPMLKNYIPELNSLIDAIRIMYLSTQKIKYKEYAVMIGAPQLSDEEIKEQEAMTEDMTESRALIQWYVLQNKSNPNYLKDLFSTLRNSIYRLGFENYWKGMERGLRQELGISKLLQRHFKKVTPGEPKEDAHYGIDFWAETNKGTTIIFQSKSSFLSLSEGIYSEENISDLEKELSEVLIPPIKYQKDSSGVELPTSNLVKIRKLQRDIKKSKEYAQGHGISESHFYLIISRADGYMEITGEPNPQATKSVENDLWQISTLL